MKKILFILLLFIFTGCSVNDAYNITNAALSKNPSLAFKTLAKSKAINYSLNPKKLVSDIKFLSSFIMEFLLIWVLGGDVIDSGLRYKTAAKCFSESQNAASEMREVGLSAPQFTCLPIAKDKQFKIYRQNSSNSRFPF